MVRQSPPCKCGPEHWRMLHPRTGAQCEGGAYEEARPEGGTVLVRPCDCTRYRKAKGANVVAKRKDYKRGRGYEKDVAEVFGGVRLGGVGEVDVVVYDPREGAGAELLGIECEETKTAHLSKARKDKHAQAERMVKGRRGAPIPMYVFREKLGHGIGSEDWVLMKRRHVVAMLERLEGE